MDILAGNLSSDSSSLSLCMVKAAVACIRAQTQVRQGLLQAKFLQDQVSPAGHLATGVQPQHIRLPQQAGLHPTAHVVLSWHHRDGLPGDVDASRGTVSGDVGEVGQDLKEAASKKGGGGCVRYGGVCRLKGWLK